MGSRLALLAAFQLIAAALLVREAAADTRARDLYKQGIEEYKAQKYEAAVATLKESYELDPKPDALFALAQAERLAGRCPEARVHYKKLLESTPEAATAKAVQTNLDLCGPDPDRPAGRTSEPTSPGGGPKTSPGAGTTTGDRPAMREVRPTDKLAILLLAGGTLGVGAGGGLYFASRGSRADADRALTLEDHDRLADRAGTQQLVAIIAGAAGAAMIGAAIVRWKIGGQARSTEVTVAPARRGAALVLSSSW